MGKGSPAILWGNMKEPCMFREIYTDYHWILDDDKYFLTLPGGRVAHFFKTRREALAFRDGKGLPDKFKPMKVRVIVEEPF